MELIWVTPGYLGSLVTLSDVGSPASLHQSTPTTIEKNLIFVVNRIYPHPKLQISVYFIEKYFRFSTENTYIELRSADTESVICNVQ